MSYDPEIELRDICYRRFGGMYAELLQWLNSLEETVPTPDPAAPRRATDHEAELVINLFALIKHGIGDNITPVCCWQESNQLYVELRHEDETKLLRCTIDEVDEIGPGPYAEYKRERAAAAQARTKYLQDHPEAKDFANARFGHLLRQRAADKKNVLDQDVDVAALKGDADQQKHVVLDHDVDIVELYDYGPKEDTQHVKVPGEKDHGDDA